MNSMMLPSAQQQRHKQETYHHCRCRHQDVTFLRCWGGHKAVPPGARRCSRRPEHRPRGTAAGGVPPRIRGPARSPQPLLHRSPHALPGGNNDPRPPRHLDSLLPTRACLRSARGAALDENPATRGAPLGTPRDDCAAERAQAIAAGDVAPRAVSPCVLLMLLFLHCGLLLLFVSPRRQYSGSSLKRRTPRPCRRGVP